MHAQALANEVPGVAIGHPQQDQQRCRDRRALNAADGPADADGDEQDERGNPDREGQRLPERVQGGLFVDVLRKEEDDREGTDEQRVRQPQTPVRSFSQFDPPAASLPHRRPTPTPFRPAGSV